MNDRSILAVFFLLSIGGIAHATDNPREWDRSKANERAARDASREHRDIQRRDSQDADRAAYERLDRERAAAEAAERAKRGN